MALQPLVVEGHEAGLRLDNHYQVWFDQEGLADLAAAQQAHLAGEFKPLASRGSTGLTPGAVWAHFQLQNTADRAIKLHLEYVDHQLIMLDAWQKHSASAGYQQVAALSLANDFTQREIPHNRFVFVAEIAAGVTSDFFVRYGSDGRGFVFPSLRLWEPKELRRTQQLELAVIVFFFGGFFLMSVFTFVVGVASGEQYFKIYSVYALSKIITWATILGYSHQFFLHNNFHWNLMSLSGALTIFCGLWFSRAFLQTRQTTPKLDYLLRFMMANAVFLFVCGLFRLTPLAVISITLALLLYPVLSVVGILRWLKGSREGGIFAIAWTFLVVGLVWQALRDLGYVQHNFMNYYWPPFASFTEMMVILVAMGFKFQRMRVAKEVAEYRYTEQLKQSKEELEYLVTERTQDLEEAKKKAEYEARTDGLTQVINRRYFYIEAEQYIRSHPNSNFSLLMFDIDHFKLINDTHGHAAGDEALKVFASSIGSHIRESDIFGRLGGEEFALLMVGKPLDVLQKAENLREAVNHICITLGKIELTFTTSIGVSHYAEGDNLERLLKRADIALYEAKESGRNRILIA